MPHENLVSLNGPVKVLSANVIKILFEKEHLRLMKFLYNSHFVSQRHFKLYYYLPPFADSIVPSFPDVRE